MIYFYSFTEWCDEILVFYNRYCFESLRYSTKYNVGVHTHIPATIFNPKIFYSPFLQTLYYQSLVSPSVSIFEISHL